MSPDVKLTVSSGLVFCTGTGYAAGPSAKQGSEWAKGKQPKIITSRQKHTVLQPTTINSCSKPLYLLTSATSVGTSKAGLDSWASLFLWNLSTFTLSIFTAAHPPWLMHTLLCYIAVFFSLSPFSTPQSDKKPENQCLRRLSWNPSWKPARWTIKWH